MAKKDAFETWYSHLKRWEGKSLNEIVFVDLDDVGTNLGIRFDTWAALAPRLFGIKDEELQRRFKNMKPAEHKEVARWYWKKSGADYIDDDRISALFAEAYWGGGGYALRWLQGSINGLAGSELARDGVPRAGTAKVINNFSDQDLLFVKLVGAIEERYNYLCERKPGLKKNLKGWLKRLYDGYGVKQPGFYAIFSNFDNKVTCPSCGHKFDKT
jgi:lysozyme family protein